MRLFLLFTVLLLPASLEADVWTFETPSQNIQCTVGEDFGGSDIECTLIDYHSPPFVPRPHWCTSDWGHVFRMKDRGHVEMVCMPLSRATGAQHTADYGVRGEFGGFSCFSSQQGLECSNLDGHGFFLSRGRQTLF